jgi:hypothetical protein
VEIFYNMMNTHTCNIEQCELYVLQYHAKIILGLVHANFKFTFVCMHTNTRIISYYIIECSTIIIFFIIEIETTK